MKIGIITFHYAHNYGAVLQAYALKRKLEEMEHDVHIINYINGRIYENYSLLYINTKTKSFLSNFKFLIKKILTLPKRYKRYNKFKKFINNNLNLSKKYVTIEKLKEKYPQYDIYITGSDQVWSKNIVGELSDVYTLNFGSKEIKRISYAASVGDSSKISEDKESFIKKLSIINKISVREEDVKKELEKIIDKDIEVVLDPTLLLSREEWNKELEKEKFEINEKYILAYVVDMDEEYKKIVEYLSEKTGLKVVHFERKGNYKNILKNAYDEGPLEFVNLIKNAEYVVATSFHATVFSIIFNKKFFIVPHKKTGERVVNLLNKLEIDNRIFNTLEEFKNIDYTFNTNFQKVNNNLDKEKEKSIKFILEEINKE